MKTIDGKSLIIGVLLTLLVVFAVGAAYDGFDQQEVLRLKTLASYIQNDGNLNIGNHKIIMLGSSIFDNGSEGGGLQIRGGANRIHLFGQTIPH